MTQELEQLVLDRIETMPEMPRKVLRLYYFENMKMREIGEVFGITESRVCQIHTAAIALLQKHFKNTER